MRTVRILRQHDQMVLAERCVVAESFISRFKGLMCKPALQTGSGVLLEPCNSIHTFFMRFSIDALYLDNQYKVLAIRHALKPWRLDFPVFGATAVLELPAGAATHVSKGDLLCIS